MSSLTFFRNHPLIGEYCVTPSDMIRRNVKADRTATRHERLGKVGNMVMVNPDPEENPRGDAAWFAIVTWIQPASEVRRNKPRLCELWWIYTRQHLIDVVRAANAENKDDLLKEIKSCNKKQAWVSNHFSEEPLDSIFTIPTYGEVSNRMRLSLGRYVKVDVENGVYNFVHTEA
ncbi:unnamed protein product [Peniophora sp. CBMAI 1063]|nr:unnamed protein product [Peniophora sp. CBMAI 1063]